jgi:hypothetical protein
MVLLAALGIRMLSNLNCYIRLDRAASDQAEHLKIQIDGWGDMESSGRSKAVSSFKLTYLSYLA